MARVVQLRSARVGMRMRVPRMLKLAKAMGLKLELKSKVEVEVKLYLKAHKASRAVLKETWEAD
jgi:hypothetical protein